MFVGPYKTRPGIVEHKIAWRRTRKAAGVTGRFHDLRHTFASLLIGQGESLAYVKEQLGHSTIRMTVDIYCHLIPGSNRQAVNRLPTVHSGVELESAEAVQESAATQRADSIQPRLSPLADCLPHPPDLGSAEGLRR